MSKLIDSDKAYEVLDRLFDKIQRNDYQATEQMLDTAWKEWCDLPTAYDVDKVIERMNEKSYLTAPKDKSRYADNAIDLEDAIEIVKGGIMEKTMVLDDTDLSER